jgi:hypothetical protein
MLYTKQQLRQFWSKVKVVDRCSCWEWQASRRRARPGQLGYGQIKIGGRVLPAHRVAFAMVHGYYPDLNVMHCCDNPLCVNPLHLKEGTHQDNMDDMKAKGRQGKKLTVTDVHAIRADPRTHREIASDYGVTWRTVGQIKKRQTWSTV